MKPGMKLKAQIRAGDLKSVIVVPRSAVVKKIPTSPSTFRNRPDSSSL